MSAGIKENVHVYLRVRPYSDEEQRTKQHRLIEVVNDKKIHLKQQHGKEHTFHRVLNSNATQTDVYKTVVTPMIPKVLEGYSCYVLAYGPSQSGKNYTLFGENDENNLGCIQRALHELLDTTRYLSKRSECTVRVSYLQIVADEMFDMLQDNYEPENILWIITDPDQKGTASVQNQCYMTIAKEKDIEKIFKRVEENASFHNQYEKKKFAHKIFTISIHIKTTVNDEEVIKTGKLNFVRIASNDTANNLDKLMLVTKALEERLTYVPYKESKLTRLLQEALGGRAKTSFIITLSPTTAATENTLATLEFSKTLKSITNTLEPNKFTSTSNMLNTLKEEIAKLQKDLNSLRTGKGFFIDAENYHEMIHESENVLQDVQEKRQKILELETNIDVLQSKIEKIEEDERSMNKSFEITKACALKYKQTLIKNQKRLDKEKEIAVLSEKTAEYIQKQNQELLNHGSACENHLEKLSKKADYLFEQFATNKCYLENLCRTLQQRTVSASRENDAAKTAQNNLENDVKTLANETKQKLERHIQILTSAQDAMFGMLTDITDSYKNLEIPTADVDIAEEKLIKAVEEIENDLMRVQNETQELIKINEDHHLSCYEGTEEVLQELSVVNSTLRNEIDVEKNCVQNDESFSNFVKENLPEEDDALDNILQMAYAIQKNKNEERELCERGKSSASNIKKNSTEMSTQIAENFEVVRKESEAVGESEKKVAAEKSRKGVQMQESNLLGFAGKLQEDTTNFENRLYEHKSNCEKVKEKIDNKRQEEIQDIHDKISHHSELLEPLKQSRETVDNYLTQVTDSVEVIHSVAEDLHSKYSNTLTNISDVTENVLRNSNSHIEHDKVDCENLSRALQKAAKKSTWNMEEIEELKREIDRFEMKQNHKK